MKKLHLVGATLTLFLIVTGCNKNDALETPPETSPQLSASARDFSNVQMCTERLPKGTAERAAVLKSVRWPNGSTLKVSLDGGTSYVRNKVIQYAREWEKYANIKFNFVRYDDSAPIKVTFNSDGRSWSYLGKDALLYNDDPEGTMHYGWFNNNTSEADFRSTTLHEFGHALGLIHEQSQPLANIPWDKPAVYDYFYYTEGWSKADVDHNVFARYTKSQTNYTAYDKSSIMHYSVDNDLTIGDFEVGWNTVLSPTDKSFIASVYPK